ncbi:MAG: lipoyl(octanoyl) transferase LipB [Candidatus Omnitrophica bacterium]|nr:lipoyl(octanoyl) transferase LipB [Candidatus Omnitrophota bacterium]
MKIVDLGLIDVEKAWEIQKHIHSDRVSSLIEDTVILCEHPTVITLGRRADENNILADTAFLESEKIKVVRLDRGGDVTLHTFGQLIVYPIFDLKFWGRDISLFLRRLEEVVMRFLLFYKILSERIPGFTGVWINDEKIASIGIGISKWVSFHGLSINIVPDHRFFAFLRSCGIKDKGITSMRRLLGETIPMDEAKKNIVNSFKQVFIL